MSLLVKLTCLCGSCKATVEILSGLPIVSITCSCNMCRHCTGVLFLTTVPLNGQPNLVTSLKSYSTSDAATRYFCGNCGSHVYVYHEDGSWSVCAGAMDEILDRNVPDQVQAFTQHEYVGSTIDGGLVICLLENERESIPMYLQGPNKDSIQNVNELQTSSSFTGPDQGLVKNRPLDQTLNASCHCGGARYLITRPSKASRQCSSPWPDLIVPHSAHSDNLEDVKWWLCGDTKYLAGTCACRSCRIGSGSPIQTWAFVPRANIRKMDGSILDYDLGTLKQYTSSQSTYREFCSMCGATAFWHCKERPDLIDVSVGLLRAPEGSRAERWLEWNTERVSFREHAFDKNLALKLEKGLGVLQRV